MKRVKAACLLQTIHFQLKDDIEKSLAVKNAREEAEHYKSLLTKNRTKYKVVDETVQPDGSILMKIAKQYTTYSIGDYLD
jgi:hypothetical protein